MRSPVAGGIQMPQQGMSNAGMGAMNQQSGFANAGLGTSTGTVGVPQTGLNFAQQGLGQGMPPLAMMPPPSMQVPQGAGGLANIMNPNLVGLLTNPNMRLMLAAMGMGGPQQMGNFAGNMGGFV
jgi:hypothetical protein